MFRSLAANDCPRCELSNNGRQEETADRGLATSEDGVRHRVASRLQDVCRPAILRADGVPDNGLPTPSLRDLLEETPSIRPATHRLVGGPRARLLLAEDDVEMRVLLADSLVRDGYEVTQEAEMV